MNVVGEREYWFDYLIISLETLLIVERKTIRWGRNQLIITNRSKEKVAVRKNWINK